MKSIIRIGIGFVPYVATAAWYFTWGQTLHWQAVLWLWLLVFCTDNVSYLMGFARARHISFVMFKELYERGHINKSFLEDKKLMGE